jgi:hypothetical protein
MWSGAKLRIESLNVITVTGCTPKSIREAFQNADFDRVTP